MFKIKICGITTSEDAILAAAAGADAIGLNFYEKSSRYVRDRLAICSVLPAEIRRVGVFVNPSLPGLKQIVGDGTLTDIQLHGDEPAELFEQITVLARTIAYGQLPVIRAFRCSLENLSTISRYLDELGRLQCHPTAVLVDAYDPKAYGGTGQYLDWTKLYAERGLFSKYPLILAGGLTPDNVAEAILTARPDAVDVASGVESAPGKKDPAKVRDFVAAAKEGFGALNRNASGG